MVAYLTKSDASEGFTQIIDFLNGSYIKYALTMNPNIYVSCIKLFCNTIAIKQCMSAKRTSWNEFSSSMASAVICLSTGKGFSRVKTPLFEGMLVGQEIEEEGDKDEHVEDVTAGDDSQGDDTSAHSEVPTVTQAPSIPSHTPTIPQSQPP
uniref:Uncharacterized protein n=1 Tax=Tanacetum cinerariifolium TaxID=118510 RepID=A0A6L2JDW7_TANCI|nr:hypothetical protein [Tanacetum cinerariifolium]